MLISVVTPTHNTKYLAEAYQSLVAQTHEQWEWVLLPNGANSSAVAVYITETFGHDGRVRCLPAIPDWGIGALKGHAFAQGAGELLVEFDHDDLLAPDALAQLRTWAQTFSDCGFFYSDFCDFQGQTYEANLAAWKSDGWVFYEQALPQTGRDKSLCVLAFPPSAATFASILWAPNHVRAWRATVYREIGGHDPRLTACDDYELLIRTYLRTKCKAIPQPLYLYRIHDSNSWKAAANSIQAKSRELGVANLERLIVREAELRGLSLIDLGGAKGPHGAPWKIVDKAETADAHHDLDQTPWPFETGSVMAFYASDILEHLRNPQRTIREIWRCLAPGGWLLSETPSTDGRGAFQDPTHVSFWNQNSWLYWTRDEQARFIDNDDVRFHPFVLKTYYPSTWHEQRKISYVRAWLHKPHTHGPRFFYEDV